MVDLTERRGSNLKREEVFPSVKGQLRETLDKGKTTDTGPREHHFRTAGECKSRKGLTMSGGKNPPRRGLSYPGKKKQGSCLGGQEQLRELDGGMDEKRSPLKTPKKAY